MKITILQPYRGIKTKDEILEAGEHELDDELADYLIRNGYAVEVGVIDQVKKAVIKSTKK